MECLHLDEYKLHSIEYRFAEIVWENEPINSGLLVTLCAERLGWKKSTTYTVLKKLVCRGFLKNENAIVTSLINKDQVQQYESRSVVNRVFNGSLADFLVAFLENEKLSKEEIDEINDIINKSGGD